MYIYIYISRRRRARTCAIRTAPTEVPDGRLLARREIKSSNPMEDARSASGLLRAVWVVDTQ